MVCLVISWIRVALQAFRSNRFAGRKAGVQYDELVVIQGPSRGPSRGANALPFISYSTSIPPPFANIP